ncbi:septum formation family protein [Streptomyces sp. NPDC026673]|uniref:DUF4190 domain-containing protein n=1 Tax=Streptomyces sp. NPDC026673 TaxID=3155724 RepID=UPI0033F420EB
MQPPPYPYHPQPPSLPPGSRRPPLNGFAIAALLSGLLLCMVPLVGVVLGAIALTQINRTGARGRRMAQTGLVLSLIGTLVCGVVLIGGGGLLTDFKQGAGGGASDRGGLSLDEGDCFEVPGGGLERATGAMESVPCAAEHAGEVVGVFRLDQSGGFPGDAVLRDLVEDRCRGLADGYAMDTWAVPADVKVYYYSPDRKSWKHGDRDVTCVFGKEQGTLEGSLRQDASMLDPHQVAYLEAVNAREEAMAAGPDTEHVEDDLEGYRKWAGEVTRALAEEARALDGHRWPADAGKAVTALVAEAGRARTHWEKAAAAEDADAFYEHYEAADSHTGRDHAVRAREALGLATRVAAANPSV